MNDEKTFNREQTIAKIMEIYDQLDDDKKAEFRKVVYELHRNREHNELKKILRTQFCPNDGSLFIIREFVREEQQKNEFECYEDFMMFSDIFEYGRIYGIKQERARRKGIKDFYIDYLV